MQIRQILVPVDFSECSKVALDDAAAWARRFHAAIDLLHVWQIPAFAPTGAVLDPSLGDIRLLELVRNESEKQLRSFASEARSRGLSIRWARCTMGEPALRIIEASRDYDLVIIGSHGRTGLSHFLLGSVAERVVRFAKCPVLTVRPRTLAFEQPAASHA